MPNILMSKANRLASINWNQSKTDRSLIVKGWQVSHVEQITVNMATSYSATTPVSASIMCAVQEEN